MMTVQDIEDAVSEYTVMVTEDGNLLGCTRCSASVVCTTLHADKPEWRGSASGWTDEECTISHIESGNSPVEALSNARYAFRQGVAAQVLEQAEEAKAVAVAKEVAKQAEADKAGEGSE